jgi:hypothetical protein
MSDSEAFSDELLELAGAGAGAKESKRKRRHSSGLKSGKKRKTE